ncbi:hypothetical protein QJS83_07565 [Bdellovibrio sp. 22V]|uniref:hypothetical protein n=1 Tax=Bdellovibrio TaxID=958 RepID=UPI0025430860|nr:hypothetical protein [Bdellovibrio sp. 22V]WII73732.1 hypothetical protein QJS83_07565 [Bdellovibrio sp. 22V]
MTPQTSHSLATQFRALSEELCRFIEEEGLAVRPYATPTLPYFFQLDEETQKEVVGRLSDYLNICRSVYKEGHQLKESSFFIRKALEYYGYEYNPNLFEFLRNGRDVGEFYTLHHTQFFRTLNYFEFTSYTIEDIYCRQWIHLYQRDEEISQLMFTKITTLVKENPQGSLYFSHPHVLKERASLERIELHINGHHISCLRKDGEVQALTSIISCEAEYQTT